jgi:hypothetical protein
MAATTLAEHDVTVQLLAFNDTGILDEEDGRPLLLADSGGRYWIDSLGGHPTGAWVHVCGQVDHSTASVSHQIAGSLNRCSIEAMQSRFQGVGEIIEGRDNLLLRTDGNQRYVLNDPGDYRPGERVRVVGVLVPLRFTLYDEGDGCILNERIEPCSP